MARHLRGTTDEFAELWYGWWWLKRETMIHPKASAGEKLEIQSVDLEGPWPFVTRRVYRFADQSIRIWSSRHHRKRLIFPVVEIDLAKRLRSCLWAPRQLNWWIGIVFAVGSLLFVTASLLALTPGLVKSWSLEFIPINAVFFAGSIPFTTAAYLQLFQAANLGDFLEDESSPHQRFQIFGWKPLEIGWLSGALQFVGTILFNFNTFDAMIPSLNWYAQDLLIWAPNMLGSILFLLSGYLAFIEICHAHWAWKPGEISWCVAFVNLLGCVGFMISAVLGIALPGTPNETVANLSLLFTLLGATGFLVGSLLMLPEMAIDD